MRILKNSGWNFTKFDFLKWIYRSKEPNVSQVGWTWRDPHPHTSVKLLKTKENKKIITETRIKWFTIYEGNNNATNGWCLTTNQGSQKEWGNIHNELEQKTANHEFYTQQLEKWRQNKNVSQKTKTERMVC